MNYFLSEEQSLGLLRHLTDSGISYSYEYEKHRVLIQSSQSVEEEKRELVLRLPLNLPTPEAFLTGKKQETNYVILLIQSGSSALGYFEGRKNLDHKVIRAYMVRKKQGTSQIKYLKTKGKSRAGSRVRLAETAEFFDNINERLQHYFEEHSIERVAISCSKTLIPYLYSSKIPPPFSKQDERLYKIPKHVHTPKYEVLLDVQRFLCRGELIYEEAQRQVVECLLAGKAL